VGVVFSALRSPRPMENVAAGETAIYAGRVAAERMSAEQSMA
jgi:hypothetical protein